MTVLADAGATVAATDRDTLTVSGLPAERDRRRCSARHGVPFSEVSAHRATLEEAYLELTRDAVEFRADGDREVGAMTAARTVATAPVCRAGRTASSSCCARSGPSSARSAAG